MANPLEQLYPNKDALRVGATLGDLLTGNVGTKGLREDTLMQTYKAEMALQQAREKRGDAIRSLLSAEKFQALPQDAAALGYNPRDVNLMQLGAHNSNASQLAETLLKSNELGVRQKVATLGDMNEQNRLLASLGNPLKINDVSGGVVTNPYQAGAPVTATPLGEAQIDKLEAQTATGGYAPKAPRGTKDNSDPGTDVDFFAKLAQIQDAIGRNLKSTEVNLLMKQYKATGEMNFKDYGAKGAPENPATSNRPSSVDANATLPRMDNDSSEMARLKAQATEAIRNNPAAEKQIIARLKQEIQRRKLKG
jgi:hypothetical protein